MAGGYNPLLPDPGPGQGLGDWILGGLKDVGDRQRAADAASMRVFNTLRAHGEPSQADWQQAILGGPILNAFGTDAATFGGAKAAEAPLGGWFKGVDKKAKFEINDVDSGFKSSALSSANRNTPVALGDVFHHPELFKQYPALAKTPVVLSEYGMKGVRGGVAPDGTIHLNIGNYPMEEAHSTLLHELQHKIQDVEDFAAGGHPDMIRELTRRLALENYQTAKAYEKLGDPSAAELWRKGDYWSSLNQESKISPDHAFGIYQRLAGEAEAREVQARHATRLTGQEPPAPGTPYIQYGTMSPHPSTQIVVPISDYRRIFPEFYSADQIGSFVDHDPFEVSPTSVNKGSYVARPANESSAAADAEIMRRFDEMRNRLVDPGYTIPIPDHVIDALKGVDKLGFDRAGEAMAAIRNNPDWMERWDVDPNRSLAEYRAAKAIHPWVMQTGGYAKAKTP